MLILLLFFFPSTSIKITDFNPTVLRIRLIKLTQRRYKLTRTLSSPDFSNLAPHIN